MLGATKMKTFVYWRGLVFASLSLTSGATSIAHADVTLQNDGFVSGGQALAEGGFVTGEAAASRFDAPDPGRQLLKVQVIYAPDETGNFPTTLKVYDDTAGTDVPGAELYSSDFQLVGSSSALQELDVTADNVIVPQQFRVGLVFQHDSYPSVTRDNDGTVHADKNFILANGVTWTRSQSLGVQGDWIIRAVVSGGTSGVDAGVTMMPDASTVGATCTGNAQCSVGEYCDTANHSCTFDCRTSADCGGGTCNSLGMCVGGTKSSGGGCCQTGRGGEGGIVLGLGVLGLVLRRRRRA
jgi:hypothetical protein